MHENCAKLCQAVPTIESHLYSSSVCERTAIGIQMGVVLFSIKREIVFLSSFFVCFGRSQSRTIEKIQEGLGCAKLCRTVSKVYLNDVENDTFTVILRYPTEQVGVQVTEQAELMDRRAKTIAFCKQPRSLKEIMKFIGLKHRPTFVERVLNPLLEAGLLKRTIPEKPRSRFQRYGVVKEAENS